MSKRRSKNTTETLRTMIRGAGLRSTQSRLAVLNRLMGSRTPLTHAQVSDDLEERGFDRATIYRSLVELADAKLLSRMELGDHVWRFEFRGDSAETEDTEHPHFLCLDCGKISCLTEVTIDSALTASAKQAAAAVVSDILLKGHCRQCR
ncbi:MAG TPA: transcriptional repressor [Pirellulales bacterium]|nr:transcriptional repressor [Pirellulales bacterium]